MLMSNIPQMPPRNCWSGRFLLSQQIWTNHLWHGRRAEGHWVYVWSDLACPQCYVGKQRLDRALAAYSPLKGRRIDVRWHAFMIDTASAPAGVRYQAYCERRWGGDGCCAMAGFPHGCASAACPASFYCFFCCQA
eukprot:jgi/Tetstr1/432021/TSEL_021497.t1